MKFTAQEEYGLRCILGLARAGAGLARGSDAAGDSPSRRAGAEAPSLTVAEVAEREGISVPYAGKLFRILGKAGLLESVRGRGGGYRLARPAASITVGEILAALGGTIYEAETCGRYTGDRNLCVHEEDCAIRALWSGLQHVVDRVLSRVTLEELIDGESSALRWIQVHTEDIGVLSGPCAD